MSAARPLALPGLRIDAVISSDARRHTPTGTVSSLRGARILLVDDNEINREPAIELLGGPGISDGIAEHGRRALEILAEEDFDALLMDCQMPEMDGCEATRALRRGVDVRDHRIADPGGSVQRAWQW